MTGYDFFLEQNLPIIMPRMLALVICFMSLIADITLMFLIKKISIHISNQRLQKNYFLSSKSWWLCASKTFTIPKNFKSKPIIKVPSLKATLQMKKSSWVANISKLSKIVSWKPSFLVFFKYDTQSINKLTSLNYLRNRRFIIFFIYHCWNKIL